MTVLFVGARDMLRAPLAAGLLASAARRIGRDDVVSHSAGTEAAAAAGPSSHAIAAAAGFGADLSRHKPRRVTSAMLEEADLVIVMGDREQRWLAREHPRAHASLFSHFVAGDPRAGGETSRIEDGGDSLQRICSEVRDGVEALILQLPEGARDAYAIAIEQRLSGSGGRAVPLSAADWNLIEQWWDRGIPLWCVLESLEEIEGRDPRSLPPGGGGRLTYITPMVEERFHAWERGRTQTAPRAGAEAPPPENLAAALRRAAKGTDEEAGRLLLEMAAKEAASLEDRPDSGEAQRALIERVTGSLHEGLDPAFRGDLILEAERHLADRRDSMSDEAWEVTIRRFVERRIRGIYGLPEP